MFTNLAIKLAPNPVKSYEMKSPFSWFNMFNQHFPMVFPWVFPWLGFRARQGASKVADLVLQAAHAAGCENQTPLAAVPWNETGGTGWNWWNSA